MMEFTSEEQRVLDQLGRATYQQVSDTTGWSRGRIYALALKAAARKNEARIQERGADRKRRQRETLEAIIDTTATADVIDFLDGLPDGCAKAIITSPPYNVGKSYGGGTAADATRHVHYHGWLMQIVSECARILAPGGALFLEVGATKDETGELLPIDVMIFDAIKRTGLTFNSRVIWTIPHGLTPKRRLAERHEVALVFSNGPVANFNAASARTPQANPQKRAFKGPRKGRLSGHPLGAWPTNVWSDIGRVGHNNPEKSGHPAQFPKALAKRAIELYTMPDDLVVDPFSGSATTHAACVETGRRFVGADLFYQDLRATRLAKAGLATVCPLPGVSDTGVAVWQAEAVRVDYQPCQLDLLAA